ncbi:MAG: DNA methyltransferase [archaeon YNP-LCB-003-016]|nr:DNA methyltransferase [Candidatus Culexarchaeum yellowstonense]
MPSESVDCVVTSPPYYGLRVYGGEEVKTIFGGNPNCEHEWGEYIPSNWKSWRWNTLKNPTHPNGVKQATHTISKDHGSFCIKCGAWKGQLGLEPDWRMYVDHLVELFKEVKRVLKKTGSLWLNIGDTYASKPTGSLGRSGWERPHSRDQSIEARRIRGNVNYPSKCLMGIPWRVAFALIDDGWILRNAIIWHKPNAMPCSVKDRLAQTYEYIFHFVKSRKYYYNLDNIREPHTSIKDLGRTRLDTKTPKHDLAVSVGAGNIGPSGYLGQHPLSRNPGDTWKSNGNLEKLIQICLKEYEKAVKERIAYDHKGGDEAPESFKAASEWNRGTRETMNKIIDSLPVPEEVKAKLRSWWHDAQSHPLGSNPGDVISFTKHDLAVGRIGNYSYMDPLHVKAYNPLGKNIGDTWKWNEETKETSWYYNLGRIRQLMRMLGLPEQNPLGRNPGDIFNIPMNSKYLEADVKTASPAARSVKTLMNGKLTTHVKQRILDVGAYLKAKLKESGYTIKQLAEITGVKQTTLEHYFRTDFSGQALPNRETWNLLKPLLNLGEYDDYIDEEIRLALPQPHPLGRNPGDYFSIPTKPFKGAHFAVFPPELPLRPILASCPPDGIVLDPLAGSGTVAYTCELINHAMWDEFRIPVNNIARSVKWNIKWIMIDINPEYCKLMEERLEPFIKQKRLDEFKRT